MNELKCSEYVMLDDEEWRPCHCPVCGGFLKAFKVDEELKCKKCGSELLVIPEQNEEDNEEEEYGKICPISKPKVREER